MVRSLFLGLACIFLLTGCSDGDDPPNDPTTTDPTATPLAPPTTPVDPPTTPLAPPTTPVDPPTTPVAPPTTPVDPPTTPVDPPTTPVGSPATANLSRLYGVLNLRYSFFQSSNIYDEIFSLSAANVLVSDGVELLYLEPSPGSDHNAFSCGVVSSTQYLCTGFFNSGPVDLFLFTLDANAVGAGNYFFCLAEEIENDGIGFCVDSVINDPIGMVDAAVTNSTVTASAPADIGFEIITNDRLTYKIADKQASSTGLSAAIPLTDEDESIRSKALAIINQMDILSR